MRNYKFTVIGVKWWDKVNGNTYHSCKIFRHKDGAVAHCPFIYGYGEQYKHTALVKMQEIGFIKCAEDRIYHWERENNYPILWVVYYDKKKECKANGMEPPAVSWAVGLKP